jgi:hypothetical protein
MSSSMVGLIVPPPRDLRPRGGLARFAAEHQCRFAA